MAATAAAGVVAAMAEAKMVVEETVVTMRVEAVEAG